MVVPRNALTHQGRRLNVQSNSSQLAEVIARVAEKAFYRREILIAVG